jgi:hypothetical protein
MVRSFHLMAETASFELDGLKRKAGSLPHAMNGPVDQNGN